jgi:hypothetical protein
VGTSTAKQVLPLPEYLDKLELALLDENLVRVRAAVGT